MTHTFTYKGYTGTCEWEDDIYYGEVNFPFAVARHKAVVTFQGPTLEEAEKEFQLSVEDYIEFLKEINHVESMGI